MTSTGPTTAFDAIIVGAGPAGVAASLVLQRSGREVVLLDKARFPRDKFCGDGLTTAALRLYEDLGLSSRHVSSWTTVERFSLRSPSGRWIDLPLPSGNGTYGVVARRIDLDAAFLDVARKEGVKVLEGHAIIAATDAGGLVTVAASGSGELSAPFLIGADGMWSPTRRLLGARSDGYRGNWHAFRQYFTDVGPRASSELIAWFESDLLPGYAWSFPVGTSGANVGFGIRRDRRRRVRDMGSLWRDLLARPALRDILGPLARPEGPHRAWPIPSQIGSQTLAKGRALWVGDAAAAVDPLTGEGIAQALETGIWAANAIIDRGDDGAEAVGEQYERSVRAGLVADDRMSRLLSAGLSHRKGTRSALWLVDRNDWTRRNFARWLWEDYPRAVLFTPRRWNRRLLARSGAYQI